MKRNFEIREKSFIVNQIVVDIICQKRRLVALLMKTYTKQGVETR